LIKLAKTVVNTIILIFIQTGNEGCQLGGTMDNSFRYIMHNKGIDTEASYPYVPEVSYLLRYCIINIERLYLLIYGFCVVLINHWGRLYSLLS
jgi:hypothetical protein